MMVNVFSPDDIFKARKEKKKLFFTWLALLIVYLAIVVSMVVINTNLVDNYRIRDHIIWCGAVSVLLSLLFGGYSLFFFSIKFRLTSKYVRMLRDMERGLTDTVDAKFKGYDENISMKDGVYFYSMILEARPLKREDITERKVLIEHTVPKIEIAEDTKLRVISHANILVSYEILD